MGNGHIQQQLFRFMASGMVTLFLIVMIVFTLKLLLLLSFHHWLWGIPVVLVSLLDIYFLTRSLLRRPTSIDTRASTLLISLGATFGFSLVAIVSAPPFLELPYLQEIQKMGSFLSIVPYPFVLWALFCLRDCLTVVPEGHKVVAHGIYRYSRHPLYVCYIIWAIADSMMLPSLPMFMASLGQIICLVLRFHREEQLLLATFAEYRPYYEATGMWGFTGIHKFMIAARRLRLAIRV
jgi:protein-S-isoprenylcysteine O-methyltransferase Ste14